MRLRSPAGLRKQLLGIIRGLFPLFWLLLIEAPAAMAQERAGDPLVIGVSLPLSGPLADAGYAVREGILKAQKQQTASGRIKLIFEDNQYLAKASISVFRSLTAGQQIDCLILFGAPTTLAVQSLIEKKNLPTVAFSAAASLDQSLNPAIIRVWESERGLGGQVRRLADRLQARQIAIVSTANDANLAIQQEVKKLLPGRILLVEEFSPAEKDFSDIAVKLQKSGADLIFSNLLAGAHLLLVRKLRDLRVTTPVIVQSAIFFDAQVRPPYPEYLNQIYLASVDDREAREFYQQLLREGKPEYAVYMTAIAFDITKHLLDSFAAGWRPPQPIPRLRIKGLLGEYIRLADGKAFEPPMTLLQFQNGKLQAPNLLEHEQD